MIGGYLSFMGIEAKANYKNTVLAEVLPVIMLDGDDRVEKPEVSVLRLSHLNILLLTGSQIIRYFLDITGPSPETMPMSY